jgi:hypothetical protein
MRTGLSLGLRGAGVTCASVPEFRRGGRDEQCQLRCRVWRAVRQPVSVGSFAWR